jgi:hypothetical protein
MVEKSNIAMYAILGLIGLAAVGVTVYFVFFHNKKKKNNNDDEEPEPETDTETIFNPPGSDTSGGESSIDVDILDRMGDDGNNLIVSALSLRRQKSSWTGPIVTLKRVVAGQPQFSTFYWEGTKLENNDGEGLDAWLGARLATWYDQSGNQPIRNATPKDTDAVLIKTPPRSGVPSFYAFDMSKKGSKLVLGSNQKPKKYNNISIYSDSNPKMHPKVATLVDFGANPVNTVFVFSSNVDSNYKNFLQDQERNPPLKKIRMS